MKKIKDTIAKNSFFILLTLYAIPHAVILRNQAVAFSFDHGKDSLAVMHMLLTKSPKLIGPWTSIPGLYFGPGWYYFLAPFYLLFNFNPLSGAIAMSMLGIFQLWLVYKFFGKFPALIVATTPFWFSVTSSAWNPFPITLITWTILILLILLKKHPQKKILWFLSGAVMSLGFHFSAAFAVLYPILFSISAYIRKVKISFIAIFIALLGFSLPFTPQLIFELRHDFIQTNGVYLYAVGKTNIETQEDKPGLIEILTEATHQIKSATLPKITNTSTEENIFLSMIIISLPFALYLYKKEPKNLALKESSIDLITWSLVPAIWFSITHFNTWYLYALMPVSVLFVNQLRKNLPRSIQKIFIILLILSPLTKTLNFYHVEKNNFQTKKAFLPVKQRAIDVIYKLADGKEFSSYQYVADIYDFSYQYLYFIKASQGQNLPVEFTYESNVPNYIVEKPDLLTYLGNKKSKNKAEIVFFIVEKPLYPKYLQDWWNRQKYDQIIDEINISDEVTIYIATPL